LRGINAEDRMKTVALLLLLVFVATPSAPGRPFLAFSRTIDQHLLEKPFSDAPAADILIILQSNMNNSAFRGIQGWN
jgi:hypothetical protein